MMNFADNVTYEDYMEIVRKDMARRRKEGYTEGFICSRSAFSIAYVLTIFDLNVEVVYNSLLFKILIRDTPESFEPLDDIKYYYNIIMDLKENCNVDEIEKLNNIFDNYPKDNLELDLVYAKDTLEEIVSSLSLLLAQEGISQKNITDTLMKVKLFANNCDVYTLNSLYKDGWKKLLRSIIETMPEGLRGKYAKSMHFPGWIVDALVDKGTISEDILRRELDKVIDFGWNCIEGFVELGYPAKHTDYIFPDDIVMEKIEKELKE